MQASAKVTLSSHKHSASLLPFPYVLSLSPPVSQTAVAPVYCPYLFAGKHSLYLVNVSNSIPQWGSSFPPLSSIGPLNDIQKSYSKQSKRALNLLMGQFIHCCTGSLFSFWVIRVTGKYYSVYEEICRVERCPGSNALPFPMPTFKHGLNNYISLGTKDTLTLACRVTSPVCTCYC